MLILTNIALYPFGLTADQIVWWGFIATLVAAVGVIVTIILTIYFGRKSLTKTDLRHLEEHTAATSGHLLNQAKRQEVMAEASRVALYVSGRGYDDQDLVTHITVGDPTVKLLGVDLYTLGGTTNGSAICTHDGESTAYIAVIANRDLQKWHKAGIAATPSASTLAYLKLRVHMELKAGEGYKDVPVTLAYVRVADTRTNAEYGTVISQAWEIHGEV